MKLLKDFTYHYMDRIREFCPWTQVEGWSQKTTWTWIQRSDCGKELGVAVSWRRAFPGSGGCKCKGPGADTNVQRTSSKSLLVSEPSPFSHLQPPSKMGVIKSQPLRSVDISQGRAGLSTLEGVREGYGRGDLSWNWGAAVPLFVLGHLEGPWG